MIILSKILLLSITLTFISSCVSSNIDSDRANENQSTRTLGTIYNDQYIETASSKKIRLAFQEREDFRFSVVSFNGIVLLAGQMPDAQSRELAAHLVQEIDNVRQVHNNITIGPKISLLTRANDSLITSHIKTIMIGEPMFPTNKVKVFTEDSVVYLMGLVTKQEADWSVSIAQKGKIKKIVKIFEYIN